MNKCFPVKLTILMPKISSIPRGRILISSICMLGSRIVIPSLVSISILSTPVYADDLQKVANIISYGTVATQIVIDTYHSAKSNDKKIEFKQQAFRTGLTILSSELVKRLVHEDRPDHSDNKSFWSEHSALAASSLQTDNIKDWQFKVGITMYISTPVGRVVAKKHHWWDTVTGLAVGSGINALVEHYVR
jgi:hypothetical protein